MKLRDSEIGIITIAQGQKKYITMAKTLAMSLKVTNPHIKRAVISDAGEEAFDDLYDIYIPIDDSYGSGLVQKLHLHEYSPFEETLFIDSDCLVVRSLEDVLHFFDDQDFVAIGGEISSGEWYMDVETMCKKMGIPSMPIFNGGTYYFKKGETATNIYREALNLLENYDELGFKRIGNGVNEEPLIAVAMAKKNIKGLDDKGSIMRTPIGIDGPLMIDILLEKCSFMKQGQHVKPAIVHFSGSYAEAFHYKRETWKLKIFNSSPDFNKEFISKVVNMIHNIPYGSYVFSKRCLKQVLRNQKFKYKTLLPPFSNL